MYPKFEILHVNCVCTHAEHTIRYMYYPEDPACPIYTEIVLSHYYGLWSRVKHAVRYIFGRQADSSHFDCFLMDKANALILRDFLSKIYSDTQGSEQEKP